MKTTISMILGYIVGGLLVLILFPSIIYWGTYFLDSFYKIEIVQNQSVRWTIATLLLLIGLMFSFWSILIQYAVGKGGPTEVANIKISPKTKNLVVSGPYKYTRNPMLFGTFSAYFAVAVFINSINALLITSISYCKSP